MDLLQCYLLDSVRICWEAAYATSYEILVSEDEVSYEAVYSTTTGAGGNVSIPISASGRYVKILCHARNTGYGVSLWEIEVYGYGRCDDPETGINNHQSPITNYKFIKDGLFYISRNGVVYTFDGRMLMRTQD